jgi:hypothetical protein
MIRGKVENNLIVKNVSNLLNALTDNAFFCKTEETRPGGKADNH